MSSSIRIVVRAGANVVLTTGGTGLSPTDVTPEATRAVLEREAPGIAEAVRRFGAEHVPTSVLSRGVAGTASHDAASGSSCSSSRWVTGRPRWDCAHTA